MKTAFKANSLILYVSDVNVSTAFYTDILGQGPIETYQDFSVFLLSDGFILGLQAKHGIDPKPQAAFGGFEICFTDCSIDDVKQLYQTWCEMSVPMALEPTNLEFGYTFVANDPDGHRLRVCATGKFDSV